MSELLGELNQPSTMHQNVTNATCTRFRPEWVKQGSRTKSGQQGGVKFNLSWIWWKSEMSLPVKKNIIFQLTGKETIFPVRAGWRQVRP